MPFKGDGILAGPVKALVAGLAGIGTAIQGALAGTGPLAQTLKAVNNEVGIMPRLWAGAKLLFAVLVRLCGMRLVVELELL